MSEGRHAPAGLGGLEGPLKWLGCLLGRESLGVGDKKCLLASLFHGDCGRLGLGREPGRAKARRPVGAREVLLSDPREPFQEGQEGTPQTPVLRASPRLS